MQKRIDGVLVAAAYLVAVLLVVIPPGDTLTQVLPVRPGDAAWRFGALGMFSRALMTPSLGLLLAVGVAAAQGHASVLRTLSVVSAVLALAMSGAVGVFVLDSLQMRGQVESEALRNFDVATAPAATKFVVVTLILLLLAVGAWRTARRSRSRRRGSRRGPEGQPRPPITMRRE